MFKIKEKYAIILVTISLKIKFMRLNKESLDRLTLGQLQKAYWYVTNKPKIIKIILMIVITSLVALYVYFIYAGIMLIIYNDNDELLMANLGENYLDYTEYRQKHSPKDLQIMGLSVLEAGTNKYDLLAKVNNINDDWQAYISYQFLISGVETRVYDDIVLPNKKKYLLDLGIETERKVSNAKLLFISVRWKKARNFEPLDKEINNFEILKTDFIPSSSLNLNNGIPVNSVKIEIRNNSSYNFWKAGFVVLLYSGSRPVGVNIIEIDDFDATSTRMLETTWFNKLPAINDIEVISTLNVLDSSIYKEFKSVPKTDIRD